MVEKYRYLDKLTLEQIVLEHRILIVNDEESIREMLRINLVMRGYDVAVSPGNEGVHDLVKDFNPDVVITDIVLNVIDGFELCRKICSETNSSVIGINMRGIDSDMLECIEIGVSEFLNLPAGVDEILARVKAVLRSRRLLKNGKTFKYREWSAI